MNPMELRLYSDELIHGYMVEGSIEQYTFDAGARTFPAPRPSDHQREVDVHLPRLQLFELHECSWFPAFFRNRITEALRLISKHLHVERIAAPILRDLIERTGSRRVIDICSGACGPILPVLQELSRIGLRAEAVLTDKYPNHEAFEHAEKISGGAVRGCHSSIDATDIPQDLQGVRTVFNAFHHFAPEQGRAILKDAHDKRQPIAVFEITDRRFWRTLTVFPASAAVMLAAAPSMQERLRALLFSYLVPVLPLAFGWDGLVSCLRSYSPAELEALTTGLNDRYYWRAESVRLPRSLCRITYLVGCPAE